MTKGILMTIFCAGLALCGLAAAQEPATTEAPVAAPADTTAELSMPSPDEWWFEVKPYIWMTAIGVDVEVGPVSADTDVAFKDLLENLKGALMLHGEAHKGPWGIFGDLMWTRLSDDEDGIGPQGGGEIEVKLDMTLLELGGTYRFGKKRFHFEPLLGVRAMFISTDVEITGANGGDANSDGSTEWVEPMIGARFGAQITKKFSAGLRGDVSGFGVGSEITWNIDGEFRYRFTDLFALTFGYRHMFIDYEDGDAEIETTLSGPVIGAAFTF